MRKLIETAYGTVRVLDKEGIFKYKAARICEIAANGTTKTVGLTGGSSPKAFYLWAVEQGVFSPEVLARIIWMTSDERMVPIESDESNFGHADRGMLLPLGVDVSLKKPWVTSLDPHSAASAYNMKWDEAIGPDRCFDLCVLGMGEDGHTLSIFPGSPLIGMEINENFSCVNDPVKGWRLTMTRAGLGRCGEIVMMVLGEKKAQILKDVLEGPDGKYPVQILKDVANRTTWLVDEAAAGLLAG